MGVNEIIKVGNNMKKLRKKAGLTQKDMGELLNIPCSTYSNFENNNREPKKQILIQIAEIFDVKLEDLLSINSTSTKTPKEHLVIPYDIKNIQKTEIIQKLLGLCGYKISFNKFDDNDSSFNQYLKQQIKNNLIPFVYINNNSSNLNLTDNQFKELSDKILQLVQFEINELFVSKCAL